MPSLIRAAVTFGLVVMLALQATAGISASAPDVQEIRIALGKARFWTGPYIEDSSNESSANDCSGSPCWTYHLSVAPGGSRLRIGIDHPEVGDVFEVSVQKPDGSTASFSPGAGLYSAETLLYKPDAGNYRVEVRAEDVTESGFRMRAKLERRLPWIGRGKTPVLPNLQVLPPHDASFLHPVTNGSTDGEPIGSEGDSCHPEEHVEDGAVVCLRFAFGVRNTGRGPMSLRLGPGQLYEDRTLYQRITRANGSSFEREAGVARYHKTHAHYHHADAIGLRLFRVVEPESGRLEAATPRRTKGFAHREELLRDWDRFYPTLDLEGFGLGPGWSDIYEWDRPGNYIEFGTNGDGRYLVRMWADPVKGIRESNEVDNVGYTYLEVTGREVELLEAGRGRDPWDPCKIVVGFGGHADPRRQTRPERCPPDTT